MNNDITQIERVPRKYRWTSTLKTKRLKNKENFGKNNRKKELARFRRKTRKSRSPSSSPSLSPPTEKKPYPMGKTADFRPSPPSPLTEKKPYPMGKTADFKPLPPPRGFLLDMMKQVKSKKRKTFSSPSKKQPYQNELLTSVLNVKLKPSQKRKSRSPLPSPKKMTGKNLIESQMSKRRGFMSDENSSSASASPFSSAENDFGSLVSVKKASPKRAKTPPKTRKIFKPKPSTGPQLSLLESLQSQKGNLKPTIQIKEPIVGENPPAFTFNQSMLNLVKNNKAIENSPNSFDSFNSK